MFPKHKASEFYGIRDSVCFLLQHFNFVDGGSAKKASFKFMYFLQWLGATVDFIMIYPVIIQVPSLDLGRGLYISRA